MLKFMRKTHGSRGNREPVRRGGKALKESTNSDGLKEKLELATNIMVIASVIVFGYIVWHSFTSRAKSAPEQPSVGTVLPALPGYSWGDHSQTLLLALRTGCHFCEDSMPFYRQLLNVEKRGKSNAHLVSVLPDGEMDATHLMRDAQLDVPMVAFFPLGRLHVSGTPTLILVDGKGSVEKAWVGEQDATGQKAVFDAIRQ